MPPAKPSDDKARDISLVVLSILVPILVGIYAFTHVIRYTHGIDMKYRFRQGFVILLLGFMLFGISVNIYRMYKSIFA
jgi:hypothetical protein